MFRPRETKRSLRRPLDPHARPDGERRGAFSPGGDAHVGGEQVRAVERPGDAERSAEPAGTARALRDAVQGLGSTQKDGFPGARYGIGAHHLMDRVDVKVSGRPEHRSVAGRFSSEGMARGVSSSIRLGLDQANRPEPPRRAAYEDGTNQLPGHRLRRALVEPPGQRSGERSAQASVVDGVRYRR